MKCWHKFTEKVKNLFKAKEVHAQDLKEEEIVEEAPEINQKMTSLDEEIIPKPKEKVEE